MGQNGAPPGREESPQIDHVSRSRRDVLAGVLTLFLLVLLPALARAQEQPTSILILHEAAGDSAGFNLFVNRLRAEMERESASSVFVYEEGMDRYEGATDRSLVA